MEEVEHQLEEVQVQQLEQLVEEVEELEQLIELPEQLSGHVPARHVSTSRCKASENHRCKMNLSENTNVKLICRAKVKGFTGKCRGTLAPIGR